jgi:uncharacterized protein YndB with AHSA1/START domain
MSAIVSSVEIERPPEEVFAYATDPSRFGEWQRGVVSGSSEGAPGVGSRCIMTRKIGGAERTSTSEITDYDPPRHWAIHGIDGPVRADVDVWVDSVQPAEAAEPAEAIDSVEVAQRSRVTIALEFHGHGLGKLLGIIVTNQARKEVPESCQKLKKQLEGTAP